MYLIAIIDVYSHCILGYKISNNLDKGFCLNCLEKCIAKYEAPAILNTDQGAQVTSHVWVNKLKEYKIHFDGWQKGRYNGLIIFGLRGFGELSNIVISLCMGLKM